MLGTDVTIHIDSAELLVVAAVGVIGFWVIFRSAVAILTWRDNRRAQSVATTGPQEPPRRATGRHDSWS